LNQKPFCVQIGEKYKSWYNIGIRRNENSKGLCNVTWQSVVGPAQQRAPHDRPVLVHISISGPHKRRTWLGWVPPSVTWHSLFIAMSTTHAISSEKVIDVVHIASSNWAHISLTDFTSAMWPISIGPPHH
jgi:hypothetical protein